MTGAGAVVIDHPERSRFELALESGTAFIDYYYRDSEAGGSGAAAGSGAGRVRVLTHAQVPVALRGGGIGAQLTAGVLELVRSRGERVVPRCSYVEHFIRRHPQYADLLAPA
ncbi:MAG TPA: GNAT family N-acetyltransferase [Steroidobacteraceae bacterium]|jgi:hypothetical protein|nr:GNAT family N-acetyltransferase [Steroidobacteraceae bacterium]